MALWDNQFWTALPRAAVNKTIRCGVWAWRAILKNWNGGAVEIAGNEIFRLPWDDLLLLVMPTIEKLGFAGLERVLICVATNRKWVSRRLRAYGLGLRVQLDYWVYWLGCLPIKWNVKVRYFVKWAATALYAINSIFRLPMCLVSFIFYFKAVCAEKGVLGSLKPPKTSFGL